VCAYVCMYVCVCERVYVCTVLVYVCVGACVCLCWYVYVCACMLCVCMYARVCVCICTVHVCVYVILCVVFSIKYAQLRFAENKEKWSSGSVGIAGRPTPLDIRATPATPPAAVGVFSPKESSLSSPLETPDSDLFDDSESSEDSGGVVA